MFGSEEGSKTRRNIRVKILLNTRTSKNEIDQNGRESDKSRKPGLKILKGRKKTTRKKKENQRNGMGGIEDLGREANIEEAVRLY